MEPVGVDFDAPVDVVFGYLSDPATRPEWQSSLRRVDDVRGDGSVGTTWTDVTAVGAKPRMRVTESTPGRSWAETGTWRGVDADLRLRFEPIPTGTRVAAEIELRTPRALLPLGIVLRALAPYAVRADLRRAVDAVGRR
jgi:uncharacterized protein YndB with AHSA1/START domain